MLKQLNVLKSERGSVLIFALLLMAVLTIIGLSAGSNTTTELKIAGNDRTYKEAFYAAETGVARVVGSRDLYDDSNLNPDAPISESGPNYTVIVTYDGASSGSRALRGVGHSAKDNLIKAHFYQVESTGDNTSTVQALGYRIGF